MTPFYNCQKIYDTKKETWITKITEKRESYLNSDWVYKMEWYGKLSNLNQTRLLKGENIQNKEIK